MVCDFQKNRPKKKKLKYAELLWDDVVGKYPIFFKLINPMAYQRTFLSPMARRQPQQVILGSQLLEGLGFVLG